MNGPWMSSEGGKSGDVSRVAMWKIVADRFDQRALGLGVVATGGDVKLCQDIKLAWQTELDTWCQ